MTSSNRAEFWTLLDQNHLRWLEDTFRSGPLKLVLMAKGVVDRIKLIHRDGGPLGWATGHEASPGDLPTLYSDRHVTVREMYHLSSYQHYGQREALRDTIRSFIAELEAAESSRLPITE